MGNKRAVDSSDRLHPQRKVSVRQDRKSRSSGQPSCFASRIPRVQFSALRANILTEVCVIFLSQSSRMPRQYLILGYDWFILHPFAPYSLILLVNVIFSEQQPNKVTTWSTVLLERPPVAQLLKEFPTFYGIVRFITMFTRALHWARRIQSTHPILFSKVHFNTILQFNTL
jgi:hypothetical protein